MLNFKLFFKYCLSGNGNAYVICYGDMILSMVFKNWTIYVRLTDYEGEIVNKSFSIYNHLEAITFFNVTMKEAAPLHLWKKVNVGKRSRLM